MSDDSSTGVDWTCRIDLGPDWLDTTDEDSSGAMMTAEYRVGDPTSLRQFLAGPSALMTLDCYGEDGAPQPGLDEFTDLLLERPGFVRRPAITYLDVPAGPAVRVSGPVVNRSFGGLRRQKGHVVTFAVAPPDKADIIELTVTWPDHRHTPELPTLANELITTLRLTGQVS